MTVNDNGELTEVAASRVGVKKLKDLEVGDFIEGSNGPVEVTAIHESHLPETMWEIEIEDGTLIKASGNHLWYCETRLDWELHPLRKSDAKKALKRITPQAILLLEEAMTKDEIVETSMIDMVTLLQASDNQALLNVITRIAESIGHIAENISTIDVLDQEESLEEVIRMYDASLFAQQILALTGLRKYKKTRIIVGSIMTTDAMIELSELIEIPVTNPLA